MHLSLRLIVQPLSTYSAVLCLLCKGKCPSLRPCIFRLVQQLSSPKNIAALTSQRLAAANNMLCCFGLLPAESAGWIPVKQDHEQDHGIQVPSYRGMSRENGNCQSHEMSAQLEKVVWTRCTMSQLYFGIELYVFRTDLLSIISSLNTVFTAIGIGHTSYTDWLLAESQYN
jgi:hypothetical protein